MNVFSLYSFAIKGNPISLRKPLCFFTILILCCFGRLGLVQAQAPSISYPLAAENLTRGYGQGKLTVRLVFNNICSDGSIVRIAFPPSVRYVPNSIQKTGGAAAIQVTESNISNANRPEFSISGINAIGQEITFTVARVADCGSLATAKDTTYFIASTGCSDIAESVGTVNTYNIFSPTLPITPAVAIGARIGTTANRSTTVTNGGNGALDTLRFFIVYPDTGIVSRSTTKSISANNVSFAPYRINGDTLFYKIFGATIFGDNLLTNGETVTIVDSIRVAKCNGSTIYGTGWGRNDTSVCQVITAQSSISMLTGVPNFNSIAGTRSGYTDKCNAFDINLTMRNGGTGDSVAAGLYDILVKVGQHYSVNNALLAVDTNLHMWSNIRINNVPVPASRISWDANRNLNIELNNLFTVDPDGPGVGLEDLDGDGYYDDLAARETFVLNLTQTMKCNLACGIDKVHQTTGATILYRTMCGSASDARLVSGNVSSGQGYIYESAFAGVAYVPANVIGGTPFRFNARAAYYINSATYDNANTRYRWKIALPSGFAVSGTGNATYGTASVSPVIVPGTGGIDTIQFTSPSNVLDTFSINLVYNCGGSPGGPRNIYYALEKIDNIVTGCSCGSKLFCTTISTMVFCPGPCSGGPSNYIPVVRRVDGSLGWTDHTLTTRQSASAISAYDLSKALYLDTINILCTARQNTASDNLHIELTLPKTSTGINKLMPVRAVARFYRAGSLIATCTSTTFSSAPSTSTVQAVDFDLSACVLALPGGGLQVNDSIFSTVSYVVTTNTGLPANDVQSGSRNIYYSLNGAGIREYCFDPVPEMFLVGTVLTNADNAYVATGCTPVTLGGSTNYLARRFSSSGQNYASEYRPVMYVDSVIATIPAGYQLQNASYQPVNGGSTINPIIAAAINGNVYKYVNPGTWVAPRLTVTNTYGAYIPFTVTPTCATVNNESINFKVYIRDYYYAYAGNPTPAGLAYEIANPATGAGKSRAIGYTTAGKPNIMIANLTGTVQGIAGTHSWYIRVSNQGLSTAPYTWISIPTHNNITILSVVDTATNTVISPNSYAGGNWYRLFDSPGLGSGASRNYRIQFTYNTCTADSILVQGGWNCGSFPTTPDNYTCGKSSVMLKLDPLPSQVQLSVARQPGNGTPLTMCTTDSAIVIVHSAQAANLVNPSIVFYPPSGMVLESPIKVEYPRGSGNYQIITASPIGSTGGYSIELRNHSTIGSVGILGTSNANPAYLPLGADREAKVVIPVRTACEFISGSSISFSAYGTRPCGTAATGSGVSGSTNAINIAGVVVTGSANLLMRLGAGSSTLACGETMRVTQRVIPTSAASMSGDSISYVLPLGMKYAGNLTPGFNARVMGGSGSPYVLKVALPAGVVAPDSIVYSFDLQAEGSGCGALAVNATYQRAITGLMCGASTCTSANAVIANGTSPSISLSKPSLILNRMTKLDASAQWAMGYWNNIVRVVYTNNGSQAYAANTDTIEFYCNNTATVPFYRAPLSKSLAVGASDSDTYSIFIPVSICAVGSYVEARIPVTTATNRQQCLCNGAVLMAAAPLPLDLLYFNAQNDDCAVQLKWEYTDHVKEMIKQLNIQRSTDGRSFEAVATLHSGGASFTDVAPHSGTWIYRLQAVYIDGTEHYSPGLLVKTDKCMGNAVNIYPNPASDIIQIVLRGKSTQQYYELYDITGHLVLSGLLRSNSSNSVTVSALAKGSYMLRVIVDGAPSMQQVQLLK